MARTFAKLTRPVMRKLAVGHRINEHGISFERTTNGDGVFSVNIMVDGQRVHRVVGRESDGTTRTQAEEFIEKIKSDARNDRLALPKGRKVALSMAAAAELYLVQMREGGGRDLKSKEQRLKLHLIPFFGDKPLNKITELDVARYKHQREKEPVAVRPRGKVVVRRPEQEKLTSRATINRELAVLSHLFNSAIEAGWIDRRPTKIVRFPEGTGRITYLTVEQARVLIECAKKDQNSQMYAFCVIGLHTAMRRGEILRIRREHIDLNRRAIHIPHAKAGAREQPITPLLAEFLDGHIVGLQPGTPWLFPSPSSRTGHTTDVRKAFRRVVKAAGLDPDKVLRHTLRHTAITHLVQVGVDLPTVKRISGHKTLAMVERYAHQNGAHISAAMDALQQRLVQSS